MPNNNVASFPYAAPSDAVLSVASDNAATSLSANITTTTAATIAVVDTSSFNTPCLIVIDNEVILANGISGESFTGCLRGFAGTTAATHSIGTLVNGYILAYQHNQMAAEVKSIGAFLFDADMSGFKLSQNLIPYSENFSYWNASSGVVINASVDALQNGSPASELVEGTSLGMNKISAVPVDLVAGTIYTFAVYAKADSGTWIALGQRLAGPEGNFAWFNLSAGTVGTLGSGVIGAAMVPVGNSWYRCMVTLTCTANSYQSFDIAITNGDGVSSYLGSGVNDILICGAQVITGNLSGQMSYIKTNGTTFSLTGSGDLVLDEGVIS